MHSALWVLQPSHSLLTTCFSSILRQDLLKILNRRTLSSSYHPLPINFQLSFEKFSRYVNMFLVLSLYSVFYFYLKTKEQNISEGL